MFGHAEEPTEAEFLGEEPPLHTEAAWRLDLAQHRRNYQTIIDDTNPYPIHHRVTHHGLGRLDVLDLPPDVDAELRNAIENGCSGAGHEHQFALSRQLAEHTYVPWLTEELRHVNGNEEARLQLLQLVEEELEHVPIGREHTYRQVAKALLGENAERVDANRTCSFHDVFTAAAEWARSQNTRAEYDQSADMVLAQ